MWATAKRIGVIGDSISTRNNGASAITWPALLESLIRDSGMRGVEVCNYSIPGLTWKAAHTPTPGWLLGGNRTPVGALLLDGCDGLIVCLGVNDRNNAQAINDALAFKAAVGNIPVVYVYQKMFDVDCPTATIVTAQEQAAMDAVYTALAWPGPAGVQLGKLYDCGMTYDKLHPTDTGKQWIAGSVYIWLQDNMPITPINRNIGWLWNLRSTNPVEYIQIINAIK